MTYDGVILKPSLDEALVHFGILGQKWGKRNGPPYPLSAGDHSAAEKKAGWRKSLTGDSATNENRKSKKYKKQYDKIRRTAKTDEEKDTKLRKLDEEYSKSFDKERFRNLKSFKKELDRNPDAINQKIVDDINNNEEYKKAKDQYLESAKKYKDQFNKRMKDPKNIELAEEKYKIAFNSDKVDKQDRYYQIMLEEIASGDYFDKPENDQKVINEATKMFKKDYGQDADPSENKYFGYYLDDAASKLDWQPRRTKSDIDKAFDKAVDNLFEVEAKVAKEYLGPYANQKIGSSDNKYLDSVVWMLDKDIKNQLKNG